jgi:hypothetical protein
VSPVAVPSIDQAEHRRRALNDAIDYGRRAAAAALAASVGEREVCKHEQLVNTHQRLRTAIADLEALV